MATLSINLPQPPDVPILLKGDISSPLNVGVNVKGDEDQPLDVKLSADIGGTTPITINPINLSIQGGDVVPAATAVLHGAQESANAVFRETTETAKKKYKIACVDADKKYAENLQIIDKVYRDKLSSSDQINRDELIASVIGRRTSSDIHIENKEDAIKLAKSIYDQAVSEAINVRDSEIGAATTAYNASMEKANNDYVTAIAAPSPVAAKVDLNLEKLPKGKLKLAGLDIGFYLFSCRIFSIKVQGEASLEDVPQQPN